MSKKLRKWVKEDCPSPIIPLIVLLLIAIMMVGFGLFALVKMFPLNIMLMQMA